MTRALRGALCACLVGCSSSPVVPEDAGVGLSPSQQGVGVLTYWNSHLTALTPGLMGAAIVGLRTFEILDVERRTLLEFNPLPNCGAPLAATVGDLDGDETPDLFVQDTCERWSITGPFAGTLPIRTQGSYPSSTRFSDFLFDRDGRYITLYSGGRLELWSLVQGAWSFVDGVDLATSLQSSAKVTHQFVQLEDGSSRALFQSISGLFFIDFSDDKIHVEDLMKQALELPYVKPLISFDNLSLSRCRGTYLGVGQFELPTRRRLNLIQVADDEASYRVLDVELPVDDILSISTLRHEDELLIGMVGRSGDDYQFVVASMTSCDEVLIRDAIPIEFNFRTAPIGEGYTDSALRKADGIFMPAYQLGKVANFVHYDGFVVRKFVVSLDDYRAEQQRYTVHEERTDIVFESRR